MTSIFNRRAASPEQEFWTWFADHEADLFAIEDGQEHVFASLGSELRRVHPELTFEVGPIEDGRRDFVISADGIRAAFPSVQALHAAAPDLHRWRVIKFRPRRAKTMTVVYGGHALEPEAVRFGVAPDHGRAAITAYIPGLTEDTRQALVPLVFLILDQALGEFDVETKAGNIGLQPAEAAQAGSVTVGELPAAFDRLVAALRG